MTCKVMLRSFMVAASVAGAAIAADWPQFRGPGRDGIVPDGRTLAARWPKSGPRKLWESESIPGGPNGGYSSVSVADGRAYVYVNWKYEAIATRTLNPNGLKQLGWLPEGLRRTVEAARTSNRRGKLKGKELKAWSDKWVKDNLDEQQQKEYGAVVQSRLNRGPSAIPLDTLAKLETVKDKTFASQAELDKWLEDNGIDGDILTEVRKQFPATREAPRDVILCLDARTGQRVWKREYAGRAFRFGTSSTPCIADGRCYVAGTNARVYCLDAVTGKEIWIVKTPGNPKHEVNSSILKVGPAVVVMSGPLTALDAETGDLLWKQPGVAGRFNSSYAWRSGGKTYLLCNDGAKQRVACVDPADGKIVWTAPGGSHSTVVVDGDYMVVIGDKKSFGVTAYRIALAGASKLWSAPFWCRGASPLVHKGYVYVFVEHPGGHAACIELSSGKVAWDSEVAGAAWASPVLADGKIFIAAAQLLMIDPTSEKLVVLGKAKMPIPRCNSPAIVDGKMFLRLRHAVACYDLADPDEVTP